MVKALIGLFVIFRDLRKLDKQKSISLNDPILNKHLNDSLEALVVLKEKNII